MKGLFFFNPDEDTIIRTRKGYTVNFQGEERPERFRSLHDAGQFLEMLELELEFEDQ